LWGDAAFRYGSKPWCVPDEAILHYAHVVLPLAEIAPDFVHSQFGLCLKDIAARFDTSQWIKISLME
jgi:7,8-dihydro-6-hydroxymethylpterin-pyrophosphokinase